MKEVLLSEKLGTKMANVSILKNGKAKAVRKNMRSFRLPTM